MKLLKGFGCVALVCLALGMSGCARYQHHGYYSDSRITRDVQDSLARASSYHFPNVTVYSHDGIVQLDGYVDTPQQQADAEQLAVSVPGVRQVVDNLHTTSALVPTGRVPIIRRNSPY